MPTCAWGLCNSDSRYGLKSKKPRPDMEGVKFFPFPKPKTQMDRCKAWIKACGRKGFVPASITRNTYVCSKHFHDGKPTPAFPDPNPASTCNVESQVRPKAKRKAPTARSIDLPTKKRKIPELNIGTNTDSCMEASGSASGFAKPVSDKFLKNKCVFASCISTSRLLKRFY